MRISHQLRTLLKSKWEIRRTTIFSQCLISRFCLISSNVSSLPVKLSYNLSDAASPAKHLSPLLILHGLFGSKQNWRSLAKSFNKRTDRQVITLDARNHGESEHSPKMDYLLQVSDIWHLFQELGVGKAVVMGHSMGGKAAMTLALCHPELVDKLIIVDSSPTQSASPSQEMQNYITAMRQVDLDIVKSKKDAEQQLIESVPNPLVRSFFLTNLMPTDSGYQWRINLDGIEDNLPAIWDFPSEFPTNHFMGETLFIGGGRSDYIQEQHYPQIFQLFPQAKIKFVPESGHWVHSEKPKEFADLVTDFLKEK